MIARRSALALVPLLFGCASETAPPPTPTSSVAATIALDAPTVAPSFEAAKPQPATPARELDDASAAARDPFQPQTRATPPPTPELKRSRRFALAELRLVGIAGRGPESRALLLDPNGHGWVVGLGELVGRPEARDGVLGDWRVDRIRDRDVVLSLELQSGAIATRRLSLPADPLIEARD